MSPVSVRRYRAEKLLRREFEALRARVLAAVAGRLRAGAVELDRADLEAAYALAWQGLYAAVLEGVEIESPSAWLVQVTYRRALDEHSARRRTRVLAGEGRTASPAPEPAAPCASDMAEELDRRIRVGQLLEGLSGRLSERERQAAALCYLQGLTRAEAAAQMGISEGRMRKLMEGRGAGDPGVSAKIGELARTIERGDWCESQGSLMRALAYGVLARDGERHRLALKHHRSCPACRAYVLSLRGLGAALPPTLLPGARLALAGLLAPAGRLRGSATHLAGRLQGALGGSRGAAGAAGASGAGGGGLALGGGLAAKLAVGCLMAIGLGAGCVELEAGRSDAGTARGHHRPLSARAARRPGRTAARPALTATDSTRASAPAVAVRTPATVAAREFGLERQSAVASIAPVRTGRARVARNGPAAADTRPAAEPLASAAAAASAGAAEREFQP